MRRSTVRVNHQVLKQHDFESASRQIKPAYGVVFVEMMPRPTMAGELFLPERSPRDDIGMVVAACPTTNYIPGTYVVINYESGKVMENFRVGTYHAEQEVRIFGRQPRLDWSRQKELHRWKGEMRSILNSQIFGIVNVNMQQIYFVEANLPIPICKRTSLSTYESYVRVKQLKFKETAIPGSVSYIVPSLYGEQYHRSIALDSGSAYRLTVTDHGAGTIDVKVEIIGNEDMEIAHVTDREIPFRPANTKVLIEMDDLMDRTDSGIFLTADSSLRDCKATIVAVGTHVQPDWKVGMRILIYATYLDKSNDIATQGMNNKALKMIDEEGIACELLEDREVEAVA